MNIYVLLGWNEGGSVVLGAYSSRERAISAKELYCGHMGIKYDSYGIAVRTLDNVVDLSWGWYEQIQEPIDN